MTVHHPMPPLNFLHGLRYSHDPRLVAFHFKHLRRAFRMVEALTGASDDAIRAAYREVATDAAFLEGLAGRYQEVTGRETAGWNYMFLTGSEPRFPFRLVEAESGGFYFHAFVYYALIRVFKPERAVETGGTPGVSTAFLLKAMERNAQGVLHTVDLPPDKPLGETDHPGAYHHESMPEGEGSGWLVPAELKGRHHQHLGDARELLPPLLESLGTMDLFIHDSDHSFQHMAWEFAAAWPYLRPGGLLISDDIRTNRAFEDFVTEKALTAYRYGGQGAVRKLE